MTTLKMETEKWGKCAKMLIAAISRWWWHGQIISYLFIPLLFS